MNGATFDPATQINTSAGLLTIAAVGGAKQVRTVQVDFMDENGALAGVFRDGERPEWKQAIVQIANESAVLRASYVPDADAEEYAPRLFLPTSRQRELNEEAQLRFEEEQPRLVRAEDVAAADSGGMASLWQD